MKAKEKTGTIEVRQAAPNIEEVLWVRELSKGSSNEEAARIFGLNPNTFAFRVANLRKKYNCKNTVQLAMLFKEKGLI